MPFTLSHPLYAVPLRKAFPSLSLTGLIAGSMAPDFEYFIAMVPIRTVGHTMEGFFLQALPLGIAFSFAFHNCVKPIIPLLLPRIGGLRQYAASLIEPWRLSTVGDWLLFLLSLFIGFLTHLFMDHWTHASGLFVRIFPGLNTAVLGHDIYHLLQYGFSLLGAAVPLGYGWWKWHKWRSKNGSEQSLPRNFMETMANNTTAAQSIRIWLSALGFAAALMAGKYVVAGEFSLSIWIVAPITSLFFGLLMAGLLHAGAAERRTMIAVWSSLAIIGAMLLFRAMEPLGVEWFTAWLTYHWILSAALAAAAAAVRTKI